MRLAFAGDTLDRVTEPHWIDVPGPAGNLKALTWGPEGAPVALCLHGFPDTAYGWRKFAPLLAESGWRVVAPFMRGYAPSSIPTDVSYHVGARMDDALTPALYDANGPFRGIAVPGVTARQQLGASTRSPATSTTHERQLPSGRRPSL